MRVLKWVLGGIVVLLVAVVVAAFAILKSLDLNQYRELIAQRHDGDADAARRTEEGFTPAALGIESEVEVARQRAKRIASNAGKLLQGGTIACFGE